MAKNPMTSGERRGVAALAIVALLVCGAGYLLRDCGGSANGSAGMEPFTGDTVPAGSTSADASDSSLHSGNTDDFIYHSEKQKRRKKRRKTTGKERSGHRQDGWTPRDFLEDTVR